MIKTNVINQFPEVLLNNQIKMPVLGLGVYKLAPGKETQATVLNALELGYRLIDTASFYNNEESVGQAVAQSGIARENIFITTKLWPTDFFKTEAAFHTSLNKLQTGYIDLYLIHWPMLGKNRAWKALEKLYDQKLIRAIGVSNYSQKLISSMLKSARIKPAVNQIEFSPFANQKVLIKLCQQNGVVVQGYSSLTHGRNLDSKILKNIADKYQKSPAQILLRWSLQHNVSVIPKSSRMERLKENSEIFDFSLTAEDMDKLNFIN